MNRQDRPPPWFGVTALAYAVWSVLMLGLLCYGAVILISHVMAFVSDAD